MADKQSVVSLGRKKGHNPIVADAAIVIIQQKLLKLLECKLITRTNQEQQIEDILKSLEPVYEFLTDHPEGGKKREWKTRLLEAVYQMEDGIDIFRYRIAHVNQTIGIRHPNMLRILWSKCLLWRCLHEFKSRITNLKEVEHIPDKQQGQGSTKEKTPQRQCCSERNKWFSLDISGNVRREDMNKLKDQMASGAEKDKITVIVGQQGLGKTHLARQIFIQWHDRFDCCAWVNMSMISNPDELLRSLLKQVSAMSSFMPNTLQQYMDLKELLCNALFGKKYLIVLDDLDDFSLLWNVVESLPDSNSGGRLLITTKEKHIAYIIDPNYIELQETLPDKIESLRSKLEIAGNLNDSEWEKVKKAITKKPDSLPQKLKLLSGFIAKSPGQIDIDELIDKIPNMDDLDPLFTHCFNKMCPELKPCLLYMALFPKGHPIQVRRLLRLWLSEGFLVVPPKSKMEPEDLGQDYLKELIIQNMVEVAESKEDGSPKSVNVVPSLFNLICSRAMVTELLYIDTHEKTKGGQLLSDQHHQEQATCKGGQLPGDQHQQEQAAPRLRWLAEHSNIHELTLSPATKINHLRSFLSFNKKVGMITQEIRLFLKTVSGKGFNLLTVLDLEGVYKPNLDKVLGKLVLLKYLGLRSTALDSLPKSVADLPYLESLDLKHTNITELPKLLWRKPRNLRHLYLNSYCHIDKSILSSFATSTETLANLHTLSGAVVDNEDQATGTTKGLSNIKKLTKLGVMFHDDDNEIGHWISSLTNLQSLKLGIIKSNALPHNLCLTEHHSLSKLYLIGNIKQPFQNLIPWNLITLTLSGSNIRSSYLLHPLRKLTSLKVLNLLANSFIGKSLTFAKGCLQNLLVLRLWKLENLQVLKLEEELANITTIELRSCPKIKEIKPIQHVGSGRTVILQLIDMDTTFVHRMNDEVQKLNEDKKYEIIVKTKKPILNLNSEEVANAVGY